MVVVMVMFMREAAVRVYVLLLSQRMSMRMAMRLFVRVLMVVIKIVIVVVVVVVVVLMAVIMPVSVSMAMMRMTKCRQAYQVDNEAERAHGQQFSQPLHLTPFYKSLYSFVDDLDADQPIEI